MQNKTLAFGLASRKDARPSREVGNDANILETRRTCKRRRLIEAGLM